ncbi:hypothetical protein C0993_011252, partial [Termitomyces sp. T159_Od127]
SQTSKAAVSSISLPLFLSQPTTDPRDSNPPQNDPHDRPRPGPLPGHHWPSLPPATATPGTPLAITAVTATSAPASAITPPIAATSAPAPATPVALGPHGDLLSHIAITHHR